LALAAAWFAGYLFGRRAAWIAGLATATSPLCVAFSRIAIFDSMLSLFVVLALICFYRAIEAQVESRLEGAAKPRAGVKTWNLLAWLALALGIMTKGPVAPALILLVIVPFSIWRKASRAVWLPWGPLAMLVLVVPWILAVQRQEPEFLYYALVVETWKRVTTDEMKRTGPIWYFLPYLLGGAFPWSVVALAGWWRSRSMVRSEPATRAKWVFLGLWFALPLLLFSLSESKRPQYILPLIPCLALLCAGSWSRFLEGSHEGLQGRKLPGQKAAALIFGLAGAVLLIASLVFDPSSLADRAGGAALIRGTALALAVAALVGGVLSWRAKTWAPALVALSLPLVAFPVLVRPLLQAVSEERSSRALAATVQPHVQPGAQVVLLESMPLSLPFYLQREVVYASTDGKALRVGFVHRYFEELLLRKGSTLRRRSWWHGEAASCANNLVFVVRRSHDAEVSVLESAGRERLGGDREYVAFGACRGQEFATPDPDSVPSDPSALVSEPRIGDPESLPTIPGDASHADL
jgi:4-amino-4-deoxy-L-arabinose transferase-like glycosyltransferase